MLIPFTNQFFNLSFRRLESPPSVHDQVELAVMKNSFEDKAHTLRDMEDCLPKQNGYGCHYECL